MAKKNLLLVDADSKSLRMLEVSLRKSGFSVTTAMDAIDARDKVKLAQPDLIITDTKLPGDENGFELVANLKSAPETQSIPIIFLSSENKLEQKVTGLELGVEDYLTKPIYIREVLTRVRVLLEKREKEKLERRERSATFAGSLGEMGLVDLIQTVEIGRKTGRLFIETRGQKGVIAFREGKVCDARCARLSGERAFYRMLVWNEGAFSMEFGVHDEADVIELSTQGLLMEGMRRVDEWGRLLEQLPPLDRVFEIDYGELVDRLAEIPDEINGILRLFDGRRTLIDVVDESDFGDLEALEIASKLFFEGLIYDVTDRPADEAEPAPQQVAKIEAWLETGDGAHAEGDDDQAMLGARLEPTQPPMPADDVAVSAPPAAVTTPPTYASLPPVAAGRVSSVPRLAELTPDDDIVAPPPSPEPLVGPSTIPPTSMPPVTTPPLSAVVTESGPPAPAATMPPPAAPASRVPGFMVSQLPSTREPTARPRPLPALDPEEPEQRSVAPRTAVGATAWSSLPKRAGGDDDWEDVVAPDDDLGLSDEQGKVPPLTAPDLVMPPMHDEVGQVVASSPAPQQREPSPADELAAQISSALPPELSNEATSSFDDDPISGPISGPMSGPMSADRRTKGAAPLTPTPARGTPMPSLTSLPPAGPDTIPEARASTSAPPTVINPVQAAQPARTEPPLSMPPVAPAVSSGNTGGAVAVDTANAQTELSAGVPSHAGHEQREPEVTPVERKNPPKPPASTEISSKGPEAASAPASALSNAPSSVASRVQSTAGDDAVSRFEKSVPPSKAKADELGERIHTAHTELEIELPASRMSPTLIAAGAGVAVLGLVLGVFIGGGDDEDAASADAGTRVAVVDAGAREPDPGADAGNVMLAAVADAGPPPRTAVVDAGPPPRLAVADAGPPVRPVVVDAGPKEAVVARALPDAGPGGVEEPPGPDAEYIKLLKAADTASKRGEFAKSVRDYKAALALKPNSVAAHLGLGNAYYELDTNDAALVHLEKARGLNPKDAQVYVLLGAVYQTAGRRDDAVTAYEKYLELAPTGKFSRDVKGILRGLGK